MEDVCFKGYQCSEPAYPLECEIGKYNDLQNQTQVRSSKYFIIQNDTKMRSFLICLLRYVFSVNPVVRVTDAMSVVLNCQKHVRLVTIAMILPNCSSVNREPIKMNPMQQSVSPVSSDSIVLTMGWIRPFLVILDFIKIQRSKLNAYGALRKLTVLKE